ncbi:MAG TPA: hypothetical protein VFX38_06060, partial [Gammaproteobacteria bacterium]|nr:hypothetical protein [Gammaproteobacteria bacterium]
MRESDGRVHKVATAAGGRAAIGRAVAAFGGALLLGASSFGVPALAAAPRLPCPSQWTQIPTEDPPNGNNPSASAVSFGSQSDGWLVGGQTNGNNVILPFAEYWNADDQSWHFGNPLLPPGAHGDVRLGGVISFAASEDQPAEAWGVGHQAGGLLLEHWLGPDPGSPWQVATPASLPPGSAFLTAVAGASRNDLWAVGYSFVDSSKNGTSTLSALIARYDGSSWNVVPAPALGDDIVGSGLIDVSAASASDVWAVGYQTDGEGYRTLIEHYDGNAWSAVSDSPNPGSAYDVLLGVWAAAGDDVWAVGYRSSGTSYSPLVLHYDGSHWNVIANTPGATLQSGFRSVAEVASSGQVAAAGFDFSADAGNYIPFSIAWPKSQPDDTTVLPPAASAGRTIGSEFRDLTVVPGADRLWTVGEPAVVETLCLGEAAPAPKVAATSMQ